MYIYLADIKFKEPFKFELGLPNSKNKSFITLSYPGRIGITHLHRFRIRASYLVYFIAVLEKYESRNLEIHTVTSLLGHQTYDVQL